MWAAVGTGQLPKNVPTVDVFLSILGLEVLSLANNCSINLQIWDFTLDGFLIWETFFLNFQPPWQAHILTHRVAVCYFELHLLWQGLVSLSCDKPYTCKLASRGVSFLSGLVDSLLSAWLFSAAFTVDFYIHPPFIVVTGWRSTLSSESQSWKEFVVCGLFQSFMKRCQTSFIGSLKMSSSHV